MRQSVKTVGLFQFMSSGVGAKYGFRRSRDGVAYSSDPRSSSGDIGIKPFVALFMSRTM